MKRVYMYIYVCGIQYHFLRTPRAQPLFLKCITDFSEPSKLRALSRRASMCCASLRFSLRQCAVHLQTQYASILSICECTQNMRVRSVPACVCFLRVPPTTSRTMFALKGLLVPPSDPRALITWRPHAPHFNARCTKLLQPHLPFRNLTAPMTGACPVVLHHSAGFCHLITYLRECTYVHFSQLFLLHLLQGLTMCSMDLTHSV